MHSLWLQKFCKGRRKRSCHSCRMGFLHLRLSACTSLQVDLHYNGFCNSVLWQLFHYVPLNMDSKLSETRTLQASVSLLTLHTTRKSEQCSRGRSSLL